jgi:hypothetical protein
MHVVLLRAERHDGNDPVEAFAMLPVVPRRGDLIEVWNAEGAGGQVWLEVTDIVLCTYVPERVEVWVRMDGYDMADLERALDAVRKDEQP